MELEQDGTMPDTSLFAEAARRQGFDADAASAALAVVEARLAEQGLAARRYFCFRSAGAGPPGGEGEAAEPPARPRLLLVFPSADDALSFAQRSGLGASPRLTALSLAQALAALLQRPAIGALLVAGAAPAPDGPRALPPGLRVARDELIALLGAPPETPAP
jgi:hypothetical protein